MVLEKQADMELYIRRMYIFSACFFMGTLVFTTVVHIVDDATNEVCNYVAHAIVVIQLVVITLLLIPSRNRLT